eukprot:TRINITY_DN6765_c0_g1_i1.p1 TRINITY_DN6765_c0_g1~~TRINITY_DN6765_c0_g1_i1.p1  ORF type:complete len:562 (+),score=136.68 TRINITY_DN6765_c0_g1_i1:141-1826(+)
MRLLRCAAVVCGALAAAATAHTPRVYLSQRPRNVRTARARTAVQPTAGEWRRHLLPAPALCSEREPAPDRPKLLPGGVQAPYNAKCRDVLASVCPRESLRSDFFVVLTGWTFLGRAGAPRWNNIMVGLAVILALSCTWNVRLYAQTELMSMIRYHFDVEHMDKSLFTLSTSISANDYILQQGYPNITFPWEHCEELPHTLPSTTEPLPVLGRPAKAPCWRTAVPHWVRWGDYFRDKTLRKWSLNQRMSLADCTVCAYAALLPPKGVRLYAQQLIRSQVQGRPFVGYHQRAYCGWYCSFRMQGKKQLWNQTDWTIDRVGDQARCARLRTELASTIRSELELPGRPELWKRYRERVCSCTIVPEDVLKIAAAAPGGVCADKILLASDQQCGQTCHGCVKRNSSGSFASLAAHSSVFRVPGMQDWAVDSEGRGADAAGQLHSRDGGVLDFKMQIGTHYLMMAEMWGLALADFRVTTPLSTVTTTVTAWAAVFNPASRSFPMDQLISAPLRWSRFYKPFFRERGASTSHRSLFAFADPPGTWCRRDVSPFATTDGRIWSPVRLCD